MKIVKIITTILLLAFVNACSDEPKNQLLLAQKGVLAASLSSDGRLAIVASANHDMALWDVAKKRYMRTLQHIKDKAANVIAMSFSFDNKFLLTADQNTIILWDLETGRTLGYFKLKSTITSVSLSNKGYAALVGMVDGKAQYISLENGQILKEFDHKAMQTVYINPDDAKFKQAIEKTGTKVETVKENNQEDSFAVIGKTVNAVALSKDGNFALTGSDDHMAVLWDIGKASPIHKWQHKTRVTFVAISPDNRFALTATQFSPAFLWDIQSGELIAELKNNKTTITNAVFSKDATMAALGVLPQSAELWQVSPPYSRLQRWSIPKLDKWKPTSRVVYALALTPNNELLTIDSSGYLTWWPIK